MKRATFVLLLVAATIFAGNATAQEKQKVKIGVMRQSRNVVNVSVTSPRPFYMGGNKFILHIDGKEFDLYDQLDQDGKGDLRFHIPAAEFKTLKDASKVYLSYGELAEEPENIENLCAQNFCPCWSLGKLNKKLLK